MAIALVTAKLGSIFIGPLLSPQKIKLRRKKRGGTCRAFPDFATSGDFSDFFFMDPWLALHANHSLG